MLSCGCAPGSFFPLEDRASLALSQSSFSASPPEQVAPQMRHCTNATCTEIHDLITRTAS